mgnify:CR=1 FL=1
MPTTKKKTTKSKKKNGVRKNGKLLFGAAAKAVLKQRAAKKRRTAAKAKGNPKPAKKKAKKRPAGKGYAKPAKKRAAKKAVKRTAAHRATSPRKAKRNPRYLVTGTKKTGGTTELGILTAPNKMQAVKRARTIYGAANYSKFSAVLSDKADYIGGRSPARKPKKKPRKNPQGELYEMFTGQPHTGHEKVIAPTGAPAHLDQLGDFVEFKWMDADGKRHTVNLEKQGIHAILAGHQYADGRFDLVLTSAPGQPLPYFGDYLPHGDHGYIYEVTYRAQKAHLGDTKPQLYYHKLGEETGKPPIFHINKEGELVFKGGEYWIEASGIHN